MTLRFPADWLEQNPGLKNRMLVAAWFIILPLEFYLLSRLAGQLGETDFSSAIVYILIYFIAVFAVGFTLSWIGAATQRQRRFRALSVALVLTWVGSASALVLSMIGYQFSGADPHSYNDLISHFVCENITNGCVSFPARPYLSMSLGWTFFVYFLYSGVGYFLVCSVIKIHKLSSIKPEIKLSLVNNTRSTEPNVFTILSANALIMTAFHSVIYWGYIK